MAQLIDGYDSIVANIPSDAQIILGYTSGFWPTYWQFVNIYSKLAKQGRVKSIAVNVAHDADFLDVESGDATPSQAAGWVERQLARGVKRPGVYSSLSSWQEILGLLKSAGINRNEIIVWCAHYTFKRHICTPACGLGMPTTADGTQWSDKAHGLNLDADVFDLSAFETPKPPVNFHYDWYYDQPGFPERSTVEAYDKLRNQPLSRIIPNRPKLKQYRLECQKLADRIAAVAHADPNKDGTPSWDKYHRGFRHYRLAKRASGGRVEG